jgi:glycosyltransferase involved in cell wall biosynthesis
VKVLHVIPAVAPRYGGPSAAVIGYGRALRARGVDVLIATTNADGAGHLPVRLGEVIDIDGVPAIFFARRGERFKRSPALAAWLARNVAGWDAVHIHAVFSHSSIAAARACRRAGVPYIVRPLGSLNPWALEQNAIQKRVLFWTGVRSMLNGAAAVHYTTIDERRRAEEAIGRLPGFVLPLGVDESAIAGIVPPEARAHYVLALARLHPVKNLEALIDAFIDVAPGAAGWRLVIAGTGEPSYQADLQARARQCAGRIVFAGWVDGDAKADLLNRAALFALPSHTENFGAGLLEACARGVPAIVSRSVNIAADVEEAHAGWVVDNDRASLARALRHAIGDDHDRAERSHAARTFAARFVWPAVSASLIAQYRQIVGSSAATVRAS